MSKRTSDPLEMWRQWMDRAERQMNAALNELMDSDSFSKTQSKAMEAVLKMQAGMNDATQRYFSTMNVATRTDVLGIANQLADIEARLLNIETLLASQASGGAGTPQGPRPRRTKKARASSGTAPSGTNPTSKKTGKKATRKTGKKKATAKKTVAGKSSAKAKPVRKKATPKSTAKTKKR